MGVSLVKNVAPLHHHTLRVEPLGQGLAIQARLAGDPHRRAPLRDHRMQGGRVPGQSGVQRCCAFAVDAVEFAQIGLVVTVGNKAGRRLLVVGWHMSHHQAAQGPQFAHQSGRGHQIAQSQPMRQCLGQAAQVQDPLRLVQAFERWRGLAVKIEFALMVVLDHHKIITLCHGQQRLSARQGHRHSRRALVARRHIDILAACELGP